MDRYLLVRGVRGHLVANPHVDPSTRRFLGKSRPGPSWDGSEPIAEVVKDATDGTLRKAIRRGGIELLGECVAESIDAARLQLQPPSTET